MKKRERYFIATIFNNKTSCSQGTQPVELEEVGGEQNEVPVIQGKSASRGVRACQPDFSPGESHGADHPVCPDTAQTGQPGDQAQAAWV